jgi:long-chain fatty acid transport protein
MRSSPGSLLLVLVLVLVLVLLAPALSRADIDPALTGLSAGGEDATSVFFSPAAITRLDKAEVVLQTAFVYQDSKFRVDEATIDGGSADKDDKILLVPGAYYVRPLGERLRLGISVNVPSGFGNDYGKTWSGRYLSEESNLAFLAAAAPLAYKLTDRWSVAAGPYLIYTDSRTKARVNNLLPEAGDGNVRLEEDGADLGWLAGVMFEPTPTTRFAVNYKSSVEPKLEGTPSFNNLDPLLREALAAADLLGTEVDVDFKVPAIAQGGFYTEFADRWSATGDVVWIDMSEFGITRVSVGQDSITVREGDFRDAWLGSAGVKYRYGDDRAVSVGAMYFSSPVSDGRRNIALPLDRVIGVGAGLERPCWGFQCKMILNYFDLGDGDLAEDGGPLLGSIEGSFSKNWALMLDIQLRKIF